MKNIFILYYLKIPVKIQSFEVENQNVTINSLMCKDDI